MAANDETGKSTLEEIVELLRRLTKLNNELDRDNPEYVKAERDFLARKKLLLARIRESEQKEAKGPGAR